MTDYKQNFDHLVGKNDRPIYEEYRQKQLQAKNNYAGAPSHNYASMLHYGQNNQ